MKRTIKNNRGVILLLTLLILSSILVVTLGAADLVMAGIKMNRLTGYSSLAFFASEAGLERALWEARKNGYPLPDAAEVKPIFPAIPPNPPDSKVFLDNNSAYIVDYASSSPPLAPFPIVTFKSIGSFSGVKRSVESTYEVE